MERPLVIEDREELIYMLCEASELEHMIMCEYLFAAFSLKHDVSEGLTTATWTIKPSRRSSYRLLYDIGVVGREAVGEKPAPGLVLLEKVRKPSGEANRAVRTRGHYLVDKSVTIGQKIAHPLTR